MLACPVIAWAQAEAAATESAAVDPAANAMWTVNNVWMMVSAFLVFIMHLGFASLESGLTRAKNTTNILFKNTAIIAIGLLTYAIMGFNIMYPGDEWMGGGKFLGFAGFGIDAGPDGETIKYADGAYTYWTDFLFQAMFAATCATIVSGAVAERIKLHSFLIFSVLFVSISYPITGSWQWGYGWLHEMGFHDFAGSTIVHSVGGWGALAGAMILGPRLGKYVEGSIRPIMGHNLPLATIGVFLLWLGWFGFNGGSVLSAAAGDTSRVLVTTNLAAAAGVVGAIVISWIVSKKPDLTMALNGSLAGLVGITAGADVVTPMSAIIIGLIAGVLVVVSVIGFDKVRIDDPVGAISVHLVCGIWGTLAVGIFSTTDGHTIFKQLAGILSMGAFSFIFAIVVFLALKFTIGLRVSESEELRGLDLGEHDQEAYSGFQIFLTQ
ncbi:MAG: ammonium transporter [Phycisphaeraceae bacterium]|nr:ammonium transporter [Phycisphaeraceae bacterium]